MQNLGIAFLKNVFAFLMGFQIGTHELYNITVVELLDESQGRMDLEKLYQLFYEESIEAISKISLPRL